MGAAVPGSPRMIPVESPPMAAPPQQVAGAGRAAPVASHPTTTTATTTATYTVAVPAGGSSPAGMPLSTPAGPVRYA